MKASIDLGMKVFDLGSKDKTTFDMGLLVVELGLRIFDLSLMIVDLDVPLQSFLSLVGYVAWAWSGGGRGQIPQSSSCNSVAVQGCGRNTVEGGAGGESVRAQGERQVGEEGDGGEEGGEEFW